MILLQFIPVNKFFFSSENYFPLLMINDSHMIYYRRVKKAKKVLKKQGAVRPLLFTSV